MTVIATPYRPEDYATLCAWWAARGRRCDPQTWLPAVGVVARDVEEGQARAAGFLYCTERPVAFLHGLVSDPGCSAAQAGRALGVVVEGLLSVAQAQGVEAVLSMTGIRGVVKLAARHGFKTEPGMMLGRRI